MYPYLQLHYGILASLMRGISPVYRKPKLDIFEYCLQYSVSTMFSMYDQLKLSGKCPAGRKYPSPTAQAPIITRKSRI